MPVSRRAALATRRLEEKECQVRGIIGRICEDFVGEMSALSDG